jgi:hypothetical protein
MKNKVLIVIFLLVGVIRAQEDLSDIPVSFATEIEVVSGYEIEPKFVTENQETVIRVYDYATETHHEYSYPVEVTDYLRMFRYNDQFLIYRDFPDQQTWMFNPINGEFTIFKRPCDSLPNFYGREEWVYYIHPETGKVHFCFTGTSDLSPALDWSSEYITSGESLPLNISPDRKWSVYFNGEINEQGFVTAYNVYSHEIFTGESRFLGSFKRDADETYVYFGRWVSDTHGAIHQSRGGESLSDFLYAFDVTRAGSLERVPSGWLYFYDHPPRYEAITNEWFLEWKTGIDFPDDTPCEFILYDANGFSRHKIGDRCITRKVWRIGDNYLIFHHSDGLVEINPHTWEVVSRYPPEATGDILHLSPDQRYVAMWIYGGLETTITNLDYEYSLDEKDWRYAVGVKVVDTNTHEVIHDSQQVHQIETETAHLRTRWCGADCFVYGITGKLVQVLLGDQAFTVEYDNIYGEWTWFDDTQLVIQSSQTLDLIHFPLQKVIPLVNVPVGYKAVVRPMDTGLLEITFQPERDYGNLSHVMVFTIRIPQITN